MRPYAVAFAAGVLVGLLYAGLRVASPAPPAVALVGLLGILAGEQIIPLAKRLFGGGRIAEVCRAADTSFHISGDHPGRRVGSPAADDAPTPDRSP